MAFILVETGKVAQVKLVRKREEKEKKKKSKLMTLNEQPNEAREMTFILTRSNEFCSFRKNLRGQSNSS